MAEVSRGPQKSDPSPLTKEALELGLANLREFVVAKYDGELLAVQTRFKANDDAVKLLQEFANSQPTIAVVDTRLTTFIDLVEAKFLALTRTVDELRSESERRLAESIREIGHSQDLRDEKFRGAQEALLALKENVFERIRLLDQKTAEGFGVLKESITTTATLVSRAVDAAFATAEKAVGVQNANFGLAMNKTEQLFSKQIETALTAINDLKDRVNAMGGRSAGHGESWAYLVGALGVTASVVMAVVVVLAKH
jgi:hypothetical protein